MPLIGYIIFFNDTVVSNISFNEIVVDSNTWLFLSSDLRLRFIYFALLFLGSANALYRLRKPWVLIFGRDENEFVSNCLKNLSLIEFIDFHHQIRHHGHLTRHGKYYDREWDAFRDIAEGAEGQHDEQYRQGDWDSARRKYETLLKSILRETFFRETIKRRFALSVCISLVIIGYILLLTPSLDLFQAVLRSTIALI